MPKARKTTKFTFQPVKGQRAIAGNWGHRKSVSMGQAKEEYKKAIIYNQEGKVNYIKDKIQIEKKE